VREAEWKAQEASNDKVQWGKADASGGWETPPPASPVCVDSRWPGLAAQVGECCGTWGPFPTNTFEVVDVVQPVDMEEHSSIGDLVEGHSACRSTITFRY
jgi:hypothetical protein